MRAAFFWRSHFRPIQNKEKIVMAQQFDWLVLGRDKNVTTIIPTLKDTPYDLLNYTIGKVLRRRVREGIDLEYAESAPTKRNVGFSRKTGDRAPLKYGEF